MNVIDAIKQQMEGHCYAPNTVIIFKRLRIPRKLKKEIKKSYGKI